MLSQSNSFFAPIPEKYNLYIVNTFEEDGSSQKMKYLCSNDRWAMAVLHYLHGTSESYSIDLAEEYYPFIKEDYPDATVIPPMTVDFEDFFLAIGFRSRLAISKS